MVFLLKKKKEKKNKKKNKRPIKYSVIQAAVNQDRKKKTFDYFMVRASLVRRLLL